MTAAELEREGPPTGMMNQVVLPTLPVALAIAIFGTIYGAMVRPMMGAGLTILSSLLIWSGTVQFAAVGLLLAGTPHSIILITVLALNVRNVVFGAILRPHLSGSPIRRAGLAWFLIEGTVGIALAAKGWTGRALMVSGLICYVGWVAGTAIGVVGGAWAGLQAVGEAVFPALFLGVAVTSMERRDPVIRSVIAAVLAVALTKLLPAWGGLAALAAAAVVAWPKGEA